MQATAFVVEPKFQGNGQETDKEVVEGWKNVLLKLVPNSLQRRVVRDQLALNRSMQGRFGSTFAQHDRTKVGAALWWEDYGVEK